ncbi:MAG TPA: hypothetical protein VG297_00810 [Bryobacteraceae bacterium]|jgi:hypothetical protein|nr:hypothetical protein [Bryobacteraceae bacterium]
MVNDQIRHNDESGGVASLFVAMVEFGDAATKFTVNQLQNGVDVFMDPGRALDRMRRSINNFSDAMYRSARPSHEHHEMETDKDLTGRRHTESGETHAHNDVHNGGAAHTRGKSTAGEHAEHAGHSRK